MALVVCAAANRGILNDNHVRNAFHEANSREELTKVLLDYGKKDLARKEKVEDLIMGIESVFHFEPEVIKSLNL
jgi:hypothetical protein